MMSDLKDYPGKLVERTKTKWYWVKHHAVSVCLFTILIVLSLWFLGSKMVYIMVDSGQDVPKHAFTPGIKVLTTVIIPDPIYDMGQPYPAQILCADGEKFLVLGGYAATKMEGGCE